MSRLFACTNGTSIATNLSIPFEPSATFSLRLKPALKALAQKDPQRFLADASAELNVLAGLKCGPDDEVVLLASDTPFGAACASAVAGIVERELGSRCRYETVVGLQVSDARRFRREGIPNLIRALQKTRDEAQQRNLELILNINGGFKSVLPFAAVFGMTTGLSSYYSYERTDELIRLPALPLAFDWQRLAPVGEALLELREREIMAWPDLVALLASDDPQERRMLELLVEREGELAAPSAAAQLMFDRIKTEAATLRVLAAPAARKMIAATSNPVLAREVGKMRDPLARTVPAHRETWPEKTDLMVWKARTPSGPRFLYWLHGSDLCIAEAFEHHDRYISTLKQGRGVWRKDYAHVSFVAV